MNYKSVSATDISRLSSMQYLGTIVKAKGFRGGVSIVHVPENLKNLKEGSVIFAGLSENFAEEYTVDSWKNKNGKAVVKFVGIDSEADAVKLKEFGIYADVDKIQFVDDDKHFVNEIIGSEVFDAGNNRIGTVKDVWNLPGNDVWLVETEDGDLPVPVIDDVVKNIDVENKTIRIDLIPGLLELLDNRKDEDD